MLARIFCRPMTLRVPACVACRGASSTAGTAHTGNSTGFGSWVDTAAHGDADVDPFAQPAGGTAWEPRSPASTSFAAGNAPSSSHGATWFTAKPPVFTAHTRRRHSESLALSSVEDRSPQRVQRFVKDGRPPSAYDASDARPRFAVLIDGDKVSRRTYDERVAPHLARLVNGGSFAGVLHRVFTHDLAPDWHHLVSTLPSWESFRVERFLPLPLQVVADAVHISRLRRRNLIQGVVLVCAAPEVDVYRSRAQKFGLGESDDSYRGLRMHSEDWLDAPPALDFQWTVVTEDGVGFARGPLV
jgi:hypothetical protein